MESTLNFDETTFPDEVNLLNYSIFDQPLLNIYYNGREQFRRTIGF